MDIVSLRNARYDAADRASFTGDALFDGRETEVPYTFVRAEWPDWTEIVAAHPIAETSNAPAAPPDMPALRADAHARAMAYGNAITGQITGGYAQAEVQSWIVQEAEARRVLAGETLPDWALLPGLAEDARAPLPEYAARVIAKADRFRPISRAAAYLRRQADGLKDEALDTPEALAGAVARLKTEADALAAQLIGG